MGIAGVNDHKTCHNIFPSYNGCGINPDTCLFAEESNCVDGTGSSVALNEYFYGPNDDVGQCVDYEGIFVGTRFDVNRTAFCPNLTSEGKRAFSIPFAGNQTIGDQQYLYAPSYGVEGIPNTHCLFSSGGRSRPVDSIFTSPPSNNTFSECAEYYNDKVLSDLSEYYEEPLPVTELTFNDYGGVNENDIAENVCAADLESGGLADYFKNAKAEYVDANFGGKDNPGDFWVKKQFPELNYIRLFGVGCYNFPGTYEGGRPNILGTNDDGTDIRAGGDFAGTMVMSFRTKEEFERYDATYGSENLKLKFITTVEGQPFPIGGQNREYTFVAQPSYNIRVESDFTECANEDDPSQDCAYVPGEGGEETGGAPQACSYGQTGYLNGRGLKHANVRNGTDVNNPDDPSYQDYPPYDPDKDTTVGRWGKVYEFCSFISPNDNPPQLDPAFSVGDNTDDSGGQLKPFFVLPTDPIPKFSGVRGPLVLLSTEEFTVDLSRFDDVIENNSCGICYTESGNVATGFCVVDGNRTTAETQEECTGTWTEVSTFTRDLCLAPIAGAPTSNYKWYASVEGITNGGAFGCCIHERTNPNGTTETFDCSGLPENECFPYSPCNTWQTTNEHNNPARTHGAGDCWSGDGCS